MCNAARRSILLPNGQTGFFLPFFTFNLYFSKLHFQPNRWSLVKHAEWPGGFSFLPSSVSHPSRPAHPSGEGQRGRADRTIACLHVSLRQHRLPSGTVTDPFSQLSSAALTAVRQLSVPRCDRQKHRQTPAPLASQPRCYAKQS